MLNRREDDGGHRYSFLSMASPVSTVSSPAPGLPSEGTMSQMQPILFQSAVELLAYVTRNWLVNYVTVDLRTRSELTEFATRPFFIVVNVDAPILTRHRRHLFRYDHRPAFKLARMPIEPSYFVGRMPPSRRWKILFGNMTHSTTGRRTPPFSPRRPLRLGRTHRKPFRVSKCWQASISSTSSKLSLAFTRTSMGSTSSILNGCGRDGIRISCNLPRWHPNGRIA